MSINFNPLTDHLYEGAVAAAQKSIVDQQNLAIARQAMQAHATAEMMNAQNGQDANVVQYQQNQQQNSLGQGQLANAFQKTGVDQQLANQQGQYQQGMLANEQSAQALQERIANQNASIQRQRIGADVGIANSANDLKAQELGMNQQMGMARLGIEQQNANTAAIDPALKMAQYQYGKQIQSGLAQAAQGGYEGVRNFYLSQGLADKALEMDKAQADIQEKLMSGQKSLYEVANAKDQYKVGQISMQMLPQIMALGNMQDGPQKDILRQQIIKNTDEKFGTNLSSVDPHIAENMLNLYAINGNKQLSNIVEKAPAAASNFLHGVVNIAGLGLPAGQQVVYNGDNTTVDPKSGQVTYQGWQPRAQMQEQKDLYSSNVNLQNLNHLQNLLDNSDKNMVGPLASLQQKQVEAQQMAGQYIPGLGPTQQQNAFVEQRHQLAWSIKQTMGTITQGMDAKDKNYYDDLITSFDKGETSYSKLKSELGGMINARTAEYNTRAKGLQGPGLNISEKPQEAPAPQYGSPAFDQMVMARAQQLGLTGQGGQQ